MGYGAGFVTPLRLKRSPHPGVDHALGRILFCVTFEGGGEPPPIRLGVRRNRYRAGSGLLGPSGSVTRAGSPAATRPPASITPSTPHPNLGPLLSGGQTGRLRPPRTRSVSNT